MSDVKIDVEFDAKNSALKQSEKLNKSLKQTKKHTQSLQKAWATSFNSMRNIAKATAVGLAGVTAGLVGLGYKAVRAANEQEDAINKLSSALKSSGDYSEEAVTSFEKFADQMQATTIHGNEAILNQIALAKSMGASNEQATKIVKIAADVAHAYKMDLGSAVSAVTETLSGQAGPLAKNVHGLRELGKEALKAGGGLDVIGSQVMGQAAAATETFTGSMAQANENFGDLLKTIGQFITNSPEIRRGINLISAAFVDIQKAIGENQEAIENFFQGLIDGIQDFLKWSQSFYRNVNKFMRDPMKALKKTVYDTMSSIKGYITKFFTDPAKQGHIEFQKQNKLIADNLNGLKKFIAAKQIEITNAERSEYFKRIKDVIKTNGDIKSEMADLYAELLAKHKAAQKEMGDIQVAFSEAEQSGVKRTVASNKPQALSGSDAAKMFNEAEVAHWNNVKAQQEEEDKIHQMFWDAELEHYNKMEALKAEADAKEERHQARIEDAWNAQLNSVIGAGVQGLATGDASGTVTAGVGLGVEALAGAALPGIGQAIGPIAQMLQGSPEEVKENVKGFAEGAITFVEAIIENLPVLIEALIEMLPILIEGIIKLLPKLVISLTKMLPTLVIAIVKAIPKIISAFIRAIPTIVEAFVLAIPRMIGELLGFQSGGYVPNVPQYRNDGGLARVSAGEYVVKSDLTPKMERFFNEYENNQLSGQQVVSTKIEFNQQTLADVILNLDRQGQRLAV